MRHRDAVDIHLRIVAEMAKPLRLDAPPGIMEMMTPELTQMALRSSGFQQRSIAHQHAHRMVAAADTWHVDPDTCGLLLHAATTLPPASLQHPMPAPSGVLVLDAPLDVGAGTIAVVAWHATSSDPAAPIHLRVWNGHNLAEMREAPWAWQTPWDRLGRSSFGASVARLLIAFAELVQQRALQHQPAEIHNRAQRRQLERDARGQRIPTIRVVKLAPRPEQESPTATRQVDWSHRWEVRGHWRQQPYRSTGEVKPIWIAAHVKGPDDKALKPKRRVVAVGD